MLISKKELETLSSEEFTKRLQDECIKRALPEIKETLELDEELLINGNGGKPNITGLYND